MESEVKIGLILSAYDNASNILDKVFGKSKKDFSELKKASVDFAAGGALIAAGYGGFKLLQGPTEAFAKMEASGNDLKAAMMGPGGVLDERTYKKISTLAMDLSDKYKGSATDYLDMVKVLKQNRIQESDILGGIGEATAKLSDFFDMAPAHIAEFSAHMRNDMGVAVGDMGKVMDLVARVHGSGVGTSGTLAVTQMNEFFSKASLGAASLGIQGLEASKQMGALGALFMSKGLSGAVVGTNFRRIFDGLRDAGKIKNANQIAAMYGKHLSFYKDGKFLGIDNFVRELGKLEDLKGPAVNAILKAFGGKQGLSTDFMEHLVQFGMTGYKDFMGQMTNQADLSDKLSVKMGGLSYQQEVFRTSTENLKATIGETFAPLLTTIFQSLNTLVSKLRTFVEYHPHLVRIAAAFVAISSGLLLLWGGVKVFMALTTVLRIFGVTLYATPVIGWIALVVSALAVLYAYWDDITGFFSKSTIEWGAVFMNAAKVIYNAIMGLILAPLKMVLSVLGLVGKALGIKSLENAAGAANAVTDSLFAHYDTMTKVKPGASARVGLYDPTTRKREGATDAVSGLVSSKDNSIINNHVTVNVSGGATAADGRAISESIQTTFDKLMKDHEQRKARRAF